MLFSYQPTFYKSSPGSLIQSIFYIVSLAAVLCLVTQRSFVGRHRTAARETIFYNIPSVDLHVSKALFSLDPDNLQLHCFIGLGSLFCCSFFCPLDQPCKALQMAQVTPAKWSDSLTIQMLRKRVSYFLAFLF